MTNFAELVVAAAREDGSNKEAAPEGGSEPCDGPGVSHGGEHTPVTAF